MIYLHRYQRLHQREGNPHPLQQLQLQVIKCVLTQVKVLIISVGRISSEETQIRPTVDISHSSTNQHLTDSYNEFNVFRSRLDLETVIQIVECRMKTSLIHFIRRTLAQLVDSRNYFKEIRMPVKGFRTGIEVFTWIFWLRKSCHYFSASLFSTFRETLFSKVSVRAQTL